jgi:hypothetical protein
MDLGGVRHDAGLLVADESVGVPAAPEGEAGFQDLVGAVVAEVAGWQFVEAGIAGFEVGGGGDHVPGNAALAERVERGEPTGKVVGGVEAGGQGSAEAKVGCDGGHDGQDDGRVEVADLAAVADIGVKAALVDVVQAEKIGKETTVEFGGF